MAESPLLDMQASRGIPLSSDVEAVTDPLLPPQSTKEMFAHFWEDLYDLRPESHLSRLLGVLLGDTGVGQLRKRYTYVHISRVLHSAHFYDLDRLFADVFGLRRFLSEGLVFDPYTTGGSAAEWEAVLAADASYRNRVEQFVRGVNMGATPSGITQMASAVVGHPVRIYETYKFIDSEESYEGSAGGGVTYGDLDQMYYREIEGWTYGSLEGTAAYAGKGSRTEFVIRPLRSLTHEERYHLIKVIGRMKPVGSMMSIDQAGVEINDPVASAAVYSSSSYWHIRSQVVADEAVADAYQRYDNGEMTEQPKAMFSDYQGEEWFYNDDILSVTTYAQEAGQVVQQSNYERVASTEMHETIDYLPSYAVTPQIDILRGRAVRDGVLVTATAGRPE